MNEEYPHTLLYRYSFLLLLLLHKALALRWMGCCVSQDAAAGPTKLNYAEQEVAPLLENLWYDVISVFRVLRCGVLDLQVAR